MDEVIKVQPISDRIFKLKFMIGNKVLSFVSVYAPQASLLAVVNELFFDQPQFVFAKFPGSELLIPVGDLNGHVGSATWGYQEAVDENGYGLRITDG